MAKNGGSFKPTHGMSKTRLYREWAGIIYRCTNPKCSSWDRYGAVGVTFCDEWRHFEPFMEWAYARVSEVSRLMTERSQLFQQTITGYPIFRHTPMRDQRVYMAANFLEAMDARVLADTYHDNFLRYADVEGVSFWQSIDSPLSVSATPVYVDNTGAVKAAAANVAVSNVLGIIFDRDALGYNVYNEALETSPYNAKGQYYNIFSHSDVQLQSDVTEKAAIFLLD